jgi:hypothetical protein
MANTAKTPAECAREALERYDQSKEPRDAAAAANAIAKLPSGGFSQQLKDALRAFAPQGAAVVGPKETIEHNAKAVVQFYVRDHKDEYPDLYTYFYPLKQER